MRGGAYVVEAPYRATFLARDARGWASLCRLVSAAHSDAFPTRAPVAALWSRLQEQASDHLVVLLGPASEPLRALSAGRPDIAEQLLTPWREVVGEGLRLEVVCWGLSGTGPGSVRRAC